MRSLSLLAAAALIAAVTSPAHLAAKEKAGGKSASRSIEYHVSVPDPTAEKFAVRATLRGIPADTLTFHFPIWGPGAYDIVNFGAYVHDFTATGADGRKLTVLRSDTNTFRIIGAGSEVRLDYKVDDIENVPNSLWFGLSDIEPDFAMANAPALFGYPAGHKEIPHRVTYAVPQGWDLAIGLDPVKGAKNTFTARDYDELVDAPLHMGKFRRYEVKIGGKPHVLAVHAPKDFDSASARELMAMTDTTVKIVSKFFGEMPYDRYVFQLFLVEPQPGDYIFGALEHRNSSTYRMPWTKESLREQLLPVLVHEYWHAWSPKRIHVRQLGPFDYQSTPRTTSLWFAEGLTEYYAQVLLRRHGFISPDQYLEQFNPVMAAGYGKPQRMSIAELSRGISEIPVEQTGALYSKGPVIGLLLDGAIRSQTGNRKSLDDAMRWFNQKYGKTGKSFTDQEIMPLIEEATGAKLGEFYRRYIEGTEPLPFDEILPKIGMKVVERTIEKVSFEATFEQAEKGWRIVEVTPGGSSDSMGLRVGDLITAFEFFGQTQSVTDSNVPVDQIDQIAPYVPEGTKVVIEREGAEVKAPVSFVKRSVVIHQAEPDPAATGTALEIRKGMLNF